MIMGITWTHLESVLESFRSFRGPLLHKPLTGQELFFAISYSKPALAKVWNRIKFMKKIETLPKSTHFLVSFCQIVDYIPKQMKKKSSLNFKHYNVNKKETEVTISQFPNLLGGEKNSDNNLQFCY